MFILVPGCLMAVLQHRAFKIAQVVAQSGCWSWRVSQEAGRNCSSPWGCRCWWQPLQMQMRAAYHWGILTLAYQVQVRSEPCSVPIACMYQCWEASCQSTNWIGHSHSSSQAAPRPAEHQTCPPEGPGPSSTPKIHALQNEQMEAGNGVL